MSISERFMVRGKRVDNGEWVIGYFIKRLPLGGEGIAESLIFNDKKHADGWYSAVVDPATVEPVAVKPIRESTLVGDYICPNCGVAFMAGFGVTNYCGNCGQRLDWEAADDER